MAATSQRNSVAEPAQLFNKPTSDEFLIARCSEESAAVDEWALTNGSDWMAAGILTGITGNRADGIIWDDLIKGREQADSDTIREKDLG